MKSTKTLVQIGIERQAEFIYVTQPNWERLKAINPAGWEYPFIPEELWDDNVWMYYGVDMADWIIEDIQPTYHTEHAKFITACLWEQSGISLKMDGYRVDRYTENTIAEKELISTSLSDLFKKTGLPDVLVVDIEGAELEVFRGYDFTHKPEFIVVETHTHDACNEILKVMLNNGYVIYEFNGLCMDNKGFRNPIFSFIREDFVNNRIRNLYRY